MTNSLNMDLWKFGSPLNHAWFHFASKNLKDQYQIAQSEREMVALQKLLELDVRDKLSRDELRSFAIQLPLKGNKPEKIDPIVFYAQNIKIDWENSIIEALDCKFLEVRISRPVIDSDIQSIQIPIIAIESTSRRGRKSHDKCMLEADISLQREFPDFLDRTREKQCLAIQDQAAKLHPGRFGNSVPGRSTVYRYLKRNRD